MQVPMKVLTALAPLCDVESSRYALGSVRLEADGDEHSVAVVTDGRRLVAARWANEEQAASKTLLVPQKAIDLLERQAKAYPTKLQAKTAEVEPDGEGMMRLTVEHKKFVGDEAPVTTCSVKTLMQEGRFPKWREIYGRIVTAAPRVEVLVDPKLLIEVLLAVAQIIGDESVNRVYLSVAPGEGVPVSIHVTRNDVQVAAMLMPKMECDKTYTLAHPLWHPEKEGTSE